MGKNWIILLLIVVALFAGCTSASSTPAAKVVSGVVTKVVSALFNWLWSLNSTTKTAISTRSMVKFESGYIVETVFDGSKLGIEPHSVEVSPTGELLLLDSENSNIYKISTALSRYSRPKLVAGSSEGYSGYVDGRLREARMNHPKGLTVDDRGNIYVADTMNMAIRKISDAGVVTIAGGKWGRGGGHMDGPSEDAKFSDDFDVVYIGSSCSLLVIDRGQQAIREIQLHDDDCSYQNDENLHLGKFDYFNIIHVHRGRLIKVDLKDFHAGVALLGAAVFFGYMLALLQRRVTAIFSSHSELRSPGKSIPPAPYQRPPKSVRPPLIPTEEEYEISEGLFGSIGRLFFNAGSSAFEIFGGLFSGFKKKPLHPHIQQHYNHPLKRTSDWPVQESFAIPYEDEPPSIDSRDPTPQKTYPPMPKDLENTRHVKQSRSFYDGRTGNFQQQYEHQVQHLRYQQHHQKNYSSSPQTFYERDSEAKEIVFGAVQEQDEPREAVVIKAVDYADPRYNNQDIRSRYNYMGYSYGY